MVGIELPAQAQDGVDGSEAQDRLAEFYWCDFRDPAGKPELEVEKALRIPNHQVIAFLGGGVPAVWR